MKALTRIQWVLLPTVVLLSGCLGNSDSPVPVSVASSGITYSGVTTPAFVTSGNAAALLSGALQGGQTGNAFGSIAALSGAAAPHRARTLLVSQTLAQILEQLDFSALKPSAAAVNNVSNQLAGNCGGQAAYTGIADDASRQFYATFTFSNYCQDGTTFSGSATASGQVDSLLGFSSLSVSFTSLTIASLGDTFTANGYEIITPAAGAFTVKLNVLLQDGASNRVYRFDQLLFTVQQGSGLVDLSITSGRYYDPRYGYIDLTTPTVLVINDGDYWPSSGILTGTGFNSSATVTALSNTVYQLDVDSNGDGTTDFTATGLWNSL